MPRLWILLLVVWYRAVAMVSTQNVDQAQLADHHRDLSILQKASHSAWQYSDNKVKRQKRSNPLEKNSDVGSLKSHEAKMENFSDALFSLLPYYSNNMYMIGIFPGLWNLINLLRHQRDINEKSDTNLEDTFNSWGGIRKRSTDIDNGPKRLPFHAWGGKRTNTLSSKKNPFGPWRGKRTGNTINYLSIPFKEEDDTFDSWRGKRSLNHNSFIPAQQYRSMMSSLDDENYNDGYEAILYRNTPLPWQIYKELFRRRNQESTDQRRIRFNLWGGKTLEDYDTADNLSEDKRTFNVWSGKHGLLDTSSNARGGKRQLLDAILQVVRARRPFNAWGG